MASIGDMLVDAGLTREHLDECRNLAVRSGESLDRIVLQRQYLDEVTLLQVYAKHLGYEFRKSLEGTKVPGEFVDQVPVHFARNYNLIALDKTSDGVLRVATCTPLEPHPMDDLAALVGGEVDAVLSPRLEITGLIARAYRHKADGVDEALDAVAEDGDIGSLAAEIDEAEDVLDVSNKAPIIKLVNTILFQALKMRASDVHFQPYPDRMQVRFRIDGILYDMDSIPRRVQDAIISRVKVMGKMDIAERRLPQDGRATIRLGDGEVDVRISSVPTSGGERLVMRLLDKTSKLYRIDEIGLEPHNREMLGEYLDYNHGIILVTGPTGSGKTTTLYASMAEIDTTQKNVLTIEDPVEYSLGGVSQVQVNTKKGLTFARGLRSFLRQDPDVMMVGEPYLVASSIVLIIAQRLVRTVCQHCREYQPVSEEWAAKLRKVGMDTSDVPQGIAFGPGCDECFQSGYAGRTAIYEFLPVTENLRTQIMDGVNATELKKHAVREGMTTLREDGRSKIKAGLTTPDEVLRVTQLDVE